MNANGKTYSKRGIVLLLVLGGLTYWTFSKLSASFQDLENSNQILASLLDNQTALTRKYAEELVKIQDTLKQTEQLLAKVQDENENLNDKIAKLGEIDALQEKLATLQEMNAKLTDELNLLKGNDVSLLGVNDISEGREMLAKYKEQIYKVKNRIGELKRESNLARIQAQREEDRLRLEAGNNGFLVRNGMVTSPTFVLPAKNVKVDVTFVK